MQPFRFTLALLTLLASSCYAQMGPVPAASFDVATIHAVDPPLKSARFLTMQGPHRFVAKNFTVRLMIAAAYDMNPVAITGGPDWVDTARFDIEAITPGESRPPRSQQMIMLASLLRERFQLAVHREQKVMPIYILQTAKDGPKLKAVGTTATDPTSVISTVYPDHVLMPARNASMADFVAVLQRAILDRPVVDHTGLTGRYDFDLSWAPSEREFGGELQPAPSDAPTPPLVVALQDQLGLRLVVARGPTEAVDIDRVEKPTSN